MFEFFWSGVQIEGLNAFLNQNVSMTTLPPLMESLPNSFSQIKRRSAGEKSIEGTENIFECLA